MATPKLAHTQRNNARKYLARDCKGALIDQHANFLRGKLARAARDGLALEHALPIGLGLGLEFGRLERLAFGQLGESCRLARLQHGLLRGGGSRGVDARPLVLGQRGRGRGRGAGPTGIAIVVIVAARMRTAGAAAVTVATVLGVLPQFRRLCRRRR